MQMALVEKIQNTITIVLLQKDDELSLHAERIFKEDFIV